MSRFTAPIKNFFGAFEPNVPSEPVIPTFEDTPEGQQIQEKALDMGLPPSQVQGLMFDFNKTDVVNKAVEANRVVTPPEKVAMRKRDRLTIDEINNMTSLEIADWYERAREDSRSPIWAFFDLLDLPRNSVANIAYGEGTLTDVLVGATGSVLGSAAFGATAGALIAAPTGPGALVGAGIGAAAAGTFGLISFAISSITSFLAGRSFLSAEDRADIARTASEGATSAITGRPVILASEALERIGISNPVARLVLGFAGDVLMDPLTWSTMGGGTVVKIGTKATQNGLQVTRGTLNASKEYSKLFFAFKEANKAVDLTTSEGLQAFHATLPQRYIGFDKLMEKAIIVGDEIIMLAPGIDQVKNMKSAVRALDAAQAKGLSTRSARKRLASLLQEQEAALQAIDPGVVPLGISVENARLAAVELAERFKAEQWYGWNVPFGHYFDKLLQKKIGYDHTFFTNRVVPGFRKLTKSRAPASRDALTATRRAAVQASLATKIAERLPKDQELTFRTRAAATADEVPELIEANEAFLETIPSFRRFGTIDRTTGELVFPAGRLTKPQRKVVERFGAKISDEFITSDDLDVLDPFIWDFQLLDRLEDTLNETAVRDLEHLKTSTQELRKLDTILEGRDQEVARKIQELNETLNPTRPDGRPFVSDKLDAYYDDIKEQAAKLRDYRDITIDSISRYTSPRRFIRNQIKNAEELELIDDTLQRVQTGRFGTQYDRAAFDAAIASGESIHAVAGPGSLLKNFFKSTARATGLEERYNAVSDRYSLMKRRHERIKHVKRREINALTNAKDELVDGLRRFESLTNSGELIESKDAILIGENTPFMQITRQADGTFREVTEAAGDTVTLITDGEGGPLPRQWFYDLRNDPEGFKAVVDDPEALAHYIEQNHSNAAVTNNPRPYSGVIMDDGEVRFFDLVDDVTDATPRRDAIVGVEVSSELIGSQTDLVKLFDEEAIDAIQSPVTLIEKLGKGDDPELEKLVDFFNSTAETNFDELKNTLRQNINDYIEEINASESAFGDLEEISNAINQEGQAAMRTLRKELRSVTETTPHRVASGLIKANEVLQTSFGFARRANPLSLIIRRFALGDSTINRLKKTEAVQAAVKLRNELVKKLGAVNADDIDAAIFLRYLDIAERNGVKNVATVRKANGLVSKRDEIVAAGHNWLFNDKDIDTMAKSMFRANKKYRELDIANGSIAHVDPALLYFPMKLKLEAADIARMNRRLKGFKGRGAGRDINVLQAHSMNRTTSRFYYKTPNGEDAYIYGWELAEGTVAGGPVELNSRVQQFEAWRARQVADDPVKQALEKASGNKWLPDANLTDPWSINHDVLVEGRLKTLFEGRTDQPFETDFIELFMNRTSGHLRAEAAAEFRDQMAPFLQALTPEQARTLTGDQALIPGQFVHNGLSYRRLDNTKIRGDIMPFLGRQGKEMFYPNEAASLIEDTFRDPTDMAAWMSMAHTVTSWWKQLTLMSPSWYVTNVVGGAWSAWHVARVGPIDTARNGPTAARIAHRFHYHGNNPDPTRFYELFGRRMSEPKVFAFLAEHSLADGSQVMRDILNGARVGVPQSKNLLARGLSKGIGAWFEANAAMDDTWRLITAMSVFDRTNDFGEAVRLSLKAHFDYGNLTKFEQQYGKLAIPFYCVPEENSEILTKRGWTSYTDLVVGELVMTYNNETDELEWKPCLDKAIFDYDQSLTVMKSKRGVRLECTNEHKWIIEKSKTHVKGKDYGGDRQSVKTKDLNTQDNLLVAAEFHGTDSTLTPKQARLMGWLLTDGYWRFRGPSCEAVIYQSPKKFLDEVLEVAGGNYSIHPETGVYRVQVPVERLKPLMPYLQLGKTGCENIPLELSRETAEAMYEAMYHADGTVTENRKGDFFAAGSPKHGKEVKGCFRLLAMMLGKRTSCSGNRGCYISDRRRIKVNELTKTQQHYKGRVWCPSTENGTWVMRQNGSIVITGNTWLRNNSALQMKLLLEQPTVPANFIRFKEELEAATIDNDEIPGWMLPEWMRRQIIFQIGKDENKKALLLGSATPLQELFEIGQAVAGVDGLSELAHYMVNSGNPIPKVFIELAQRREIFTGREIGDPELGQMSLSEYLRRQINPARLIESVSKTAKRSGAGDAAIRGLFGGRYQQLSVDRLRAMHAVETMNRIQTLRRVLNRKPSKSIANRIVLEYYKLWQLDMTNRVPKALHSTMRELDAERAGEAAGAVSDLEGVSTLPVTAEAAATTSG